MNNDLEKKATQKARTVDPHDLPFATSADEWQTWVSDKGAWIFIEKVVIAAISTAFLFDKDQAFQWVGTRMLEWLSENSAKLKPRSIWKIEFAGLKDTPVNFAVFNNKCFVFTPRKMDKK